MNSTSSGVGDGPSTGPLRAVLGPLCRCVPKRCSGDHQRVLSLNRPIASLAKAINRTGSVVRGPRNSGTRQLVPLWQTRADLAVGCAAALDIAPPVGVAA